MPESVGAVGALTMTHEGDAVYRLDVNGVLRKADFDRLQAALSREIDRVGPVRLLVVLDRFEGWDASDNWSDLSFYATYGDRIARIAIVGEERWRSHMLMFAVADLRKAPVEYFAEQAIAQARAWLHQ
jgi:hypothetical protein